MVGLECGEAEAADPGENVGLQHPAVVARRRSRPGDTDTRKPALQVGGESLASGLGDGAALCPSDELGERRLSCLLRREASALLLPPLPVRRWRQVDDEEPGPP